MSSKLQRNAVLLPARPHDKFARTLADYRRGIFMFGKAILSSWMLVGALVAQNQDVGTGGPGKSGAHPTVGHKPCMVGQNPLDGHNTGNTCDGHGHSQK